MISYAICTTPRTGSNYLCSLLHEVGLGKPDEYLSSHRPRDWDTLPKLWNRHCEDWGVFGIKLRWEHRERLDFVDFHEVLPPGGKWIFLHREDVHSQAQSFLTAYESGEWMIPYQPYGSLPENTLAIARGRILRQNEDWKLWFARHSLDYLTVTYETLVSSPATLLNQIRAYIHA